MENKKNKAIVDLILICFLNGLIIISIVLLITTDSLLGKQFETTNKPSTFLIISSQISYRSYSPQKHNVIKSIDSELISPSSSASPSPPDSTTTTTTTTTLPPV